MDKSISESEANLNFPEILGHGIVTAHDKPVSRIMPYTITDMARKSARANLMQRLNAQAAIDTGRWRRNELYQR